MTMEYSLNVVFKEKSVKSRGTVSGASYLISHGGTYVTQVRLLPEPSSRYCMPAQLCTTLF